MANDMVSACTERPDDAGAAADLLRQLDGVDPSAVLLFYAHARDGAALVKATRERFRGAEVIACTTAGEFTDRSYGVGGVAAMAISRRTVPRAFGSLARFEHGVLEGIRGAAADISGKLGTNLRECEPTRHVGLVLLEGIKQKEEAANDALGQVAPLLSFVGGSAGDDFRFQETKVHHNDQSSTDGAALLVLEVAGRFTPMKTCSFRPRAGSPALRVTRADPARRIVYELDGRPIVEVYSQILDTPAARIGRLAFARHPLGLMIDGEPWIRSPQNVQPDGGITFACQIIEGTQVHFMDPTDLIDDTRRAFADAERALGGSIGGAILFNCVHRRYELEEQKLVQPFQRLLRFPTVGFHTYGESWLGHINHTLTGLLLA